MSEVKTIVLQKPVTIGERTVSELNFPTDPVFGLLGAGDKGVGEMDKIFHIIAAATGEHVMFIKQLKGVDVKPVREAAEEMLGELLQLNPSPPTSDM